MIPQTAVEEAIVRAVRVAPSHAVAIRLEEYNGYTLATFAWTRQFKYRTKIVVVATGNEIHFGVIDQALAEVAKA